jgi:hypothetical protein
MLWFLERMKKYRAYHGYAWLRRGIRVPEVLYLNIDFQFYLL